MENSIFFDSQLLYLLIVKWFFILQGVSFVILQVLTIHSPSFKLVAPELFKCFSQCRMPWIQQISFFEYSRIFIFDGSNELTIEEIKLSKRRIRVELGAQHFFFQSHFLLRGTQIPKTLELSEIRKTSIDMQKHLQIKVHFSFLLDSWNERLGNSVAVLVPSLNAYRWHCNIFCFKKWIIRYFN